MKKIFIIAMITFIIGCGATIDKIEVSRTNIGKIIDANVIPTSFNESIKTQVKTEGGFFLLIGCPHIPFGVEAVIVEYDNGSRYVTWHGTDRLYRI